MFELESSQQDDHYFKVVMKANYKLNLEQNLSIENQCFVMNDSHFENQILIYQEGELKSFRLSQKQTNCTYEFK